MIVACGGIKGGVGKTTIAVHLAVLAAMAGREVLLIDGDSQGSASDFTAIRREARGGDTGYTNVQLSGAAIRAEGMRLAPKYDEVIIDVGGRDSAGQRAALAMSDVVVLPFLPGSFDIWGLEKTITLLEEVRAYNDHLRALALLNRADPSNKDNLAALDTVDDIGSLHVLESRIGNRKAFRAATGQGLIVTELRPRDDKAVAEINQLFLEIFPEIHAVESL
ncbi:Plasmid segregation oscillating ATPase ParF [Gammaproteobacteria bacterium]